MQAPIKTSLQFQVFRRIQSLHLPDPVLLATFDGLEDAIRFVAYRGKLGSRRPDENLTIFKNARGKLEQIWEPYYQGFRL